MDYKVYIPPIPPKPKPKKPWIICPQITILFILLLFIYQASYLLPGATLLGKLLLAIYLLLLLAMEIFVNLAIILRNYLFYFIALILSVIYAIIDTLLYLVGTIISLTKNTMRIKDKIIPIIYITFIDWLITIVLLIYKKKIRKIIDSDFDKSLQDLNQQQQPLV